MNIPTRFLGIDGLRAFSVILVLLAHWAPTPALDSLMVWANGGRGGLLVFFVISGFLITGILLDMREHGHELSPAQQLKKFYLRRAFRIFPLYYLVLFYLVKIDLTTAVTQDAIWHALFLNNLSAIFLHGGIGAYGPTFPWWSLAVEEQFYLCWALVALLAPKKWLPIAIGLGAFSAIGFRYWGWAVDAPRAMIIPFTVANLDALAAGCAVAMLIRSKVADSPTSGRIAITIFLSTITLFLFTLYVNISNRIVDVKANGWNLVFDDTVWYMAAASLIFLLVTGRLKWVGRALEHPIVVFVGKRSYGMYILHQVVAHTIAFRLGPKFEKFTGIKFGLYGPVECLTFFVVTLALATISYKYFETPILNLRERRPLTSAV